MSARSTTLRIRALMLDLARLELECVQLGILHEDRVVPQGIELHAQWESLALATQGSPRALRTEVEPTPFEQPPTPVVESAVELFSDPRVQDPNTSRDAATWSTVMREPSMFEDSAHALIHDRDGAVVGRAHVLQRQETVRSSRDDEAENDEPKRE